MIMSISITDQITGHIQRLSTFTEGGALDFSDKKIKDAVNFLSRQALVNFSEEQKSHLSNSITILVKRVNEENPGGINKTYELIDRSIFVFKCIEKPSLSKAGTPLHVEAIRSGVPFHVEAIRQATNTVKEHLEKGLSLKKEVTLQTFARQYCSDMFDMYDQSKRERLYLIRNSSTLIPKHVGDERQEPFVFSYRFNSKEMHQLLIHVTNVVTGAKEWRPGESRGLYNFQPYGEGSTLTELIRRKTEGKRFRPVMPWSDQRLSNYVISNYFADSGALSSRKRAIESDEPPEKKRRIDPTTT